MATAELRSILKTRDPETLGEPAVSPEVFARDFDATEAIDRLTRSPTTTDLQNRRVTWHPQTKQIEKQSDGVVAQVKKVIVVKDLATYVSSAVRCGHRLIRVQHGDATNLLYVQKNSRQPSHFGVVSILNVSSKKASAFAEKDLNTVALAIFNTVPAVFVDAMSQVPEEHQDDYLTLIRTARGTRLPKFHAIAVQLNQHYAEHQDLLAVTKALMLQINNRKGIKFEELFYLNRDIVLRMTELTLNLIRLAQVPAKFGDLFVDRIKMQAQKPDYFKRLKFEMVKKDEILAFNQVIHLPSGELKSSDELLRIAARLEHAYKLDQEVQLSPLFRKCLFVLDEMGYAGIFDELLPGEMEIYQEGDFDFDDLDPDLTCFDADELIRGFQREVALGPVPELEKVEGIESPEIPDRKTRR